jgi:N-acetylmuramoyl-L-alanine amidase
VWQRVIGRYRLVVARYPRSGYCDDALLAVGDLYRAMAKRFKKPALLDEAARAYEALAGEYPSSRHAETALFAVFEIARSSRDKKRLLEAGRSYVDAFPDSPRAPAVKATLRQRVPDKAASLPSPPPPGLASIYDLRFWSGTAATRVVVDLARKVKIESDRIRDPERLWIDLLGTRLHPRLEKRHFAVGDGLLEAIRVGPNREGVVRVVLDFKEVGDYNLFYLDDPPRLVVDVKGRARPMVASAPAAEREQETAVARAAPPAVVEVVPDADGDVGTDDPAAPSVPRAAPSPSPAPAREEVAQSTAPAATSAPAAPESLPSRRVSALASVEPPPPGPPKPAPSPVVIDSPPPPRRSAVAQASPAPAPAPGPPPAAQANRAGSYSLARQLGLGARRIVIDAGHGGHDPGTIGRGGLMEKDLVLDVALRLEKMVRQELGAEVLLTRGTDVFVPLEERTAIANSRGADLFLSIHANSSRNSRARGVETYFLSFARDAHAEEVAARENAISAATMKDLQGLVKAIALNSKIDESRDFAASVQEALVETIRGRYPVTNRGVHTAPFYVLIGANMPSILAEIAFLSNPEDEKLLKTPAYREAIARSLLKGVRGYLEGLPRPPARALTSLAPRSTVADGGR